MTLAWFTQADLGHHNGDHIKRVFKKFDSGGAGTDDPHAERGERTGRRALTPAQGLERGRDGGEA